jgi:hypothetical protein
MNKTRQPRCTFVLSQVKHCKSAYIIIVSERNEEAFQTLTNLPISKQEREKNMSNVVYLNNRKSAQNTVLGAAGVDLELSKGIITMKHCETKEILYSFVAQKNDWDKIIDFIRSFSDAA